jgi:Tfp pilus assembly protein PilX
MFYLSTCVQLDLTSACGSGDQSKTWVPQIGSPAWMQIHKVVDSGADAAAGEHLASNQEPGYALKVSNALAMYLRSLLSLSLSGLSLSLSLFLSLSLNTHTHHADVIQG